MSSESVKGEDNTRKIKIEAIDRTSEPVTSTPPSSPPPAMKAQPNSMAPPPPPTGSRKRSSDEMHGRPHSAASSRTSDAGIAQPGPRGKDDTSNDLESIKQSDSQTEAHAVKASKEAPTHTSTPKQSQQTPPSGQGSQKPRSKSATSAKPPKQQATDDNEADSDTSDSADQEAPEDPIDDFAWRQLEQRFHAIIDEFGDKEVAILQEFRSLVEYFSMWAQVGSGKDTDRGYKRLKTQIKYVENEEQVLEHKRQHYVQVVEAFKTIADMLNEPDVVKGHAILRRRKAVAKVKRAASSRPRISFDDYGARTLADVDGSGHGCWDFSASRCAVM